VRLANHRPTPAQRIGRIADLVDTWFVWLLVALLGMSAVTALGVAVTAYNRHAPTWATTLVISLLVTNAALGVLVWAVVAARQAITAHQRATDPR
jgi:L-asparagine transporter-like permease